MRHVSKSRRFLDQIICADKYIERNREAIRATQRKRGRHRTARLDSHAAVSRWEPYQFSRAPVPAEACSIDVVRSSHLDSVRPGTDNCVMEDAVLHDTTLLAFEIVANNRDGMRVELQTIGEAAGFICDEFIGERASDADWKHAATSLAAASGNSALVQQATEAVHSLLKTAGMLSD
jgi:hypothetical protein